ncbi:hypothetical protein [Euryhalocaulis caribicus]|uniref:hypothetical protein n=1 Tax=Euryhalocaulis caribicus TaxID=1161401 RepID=UPI0003A100A7|nr:hypothetical protein [Euryhalocaulis caribicus]
MPWVEFLENADVRLSRRAFRNYKAGTRALITTPEAERLIEAGKARKSAKPKAEPAGQEPEGERIDLTEQAEIIEDDAGRS